MLFFINEIVLREPGVMMKSASVRDLCNALFSMVNTITLQLLKGILCVGHGSFILTPNFM